MHAQHTMRYRTIALLGSILVLAACSQPAAPVANDSFMTCNSGVVIRTGQSCDNQ